MRNQYIFHRSKENSACFISTQVMSDLPREVSPPPPAVYLVNFENYLRPKKPNKCQPLQRFAKPVSKTSKLTQSLKRLRLIKWYVRLSKRFKELPLPRCLAFLRARNDDGLCKRKTGFEIYCEMASIHGFHIFVGAKTWQRILWWLLICTAVMLSLIVVIMSQSMSKKMPTIRFMDTMMKPAAEVPFPAVTICGLSSISKKILNTKAMELGLSAEVLQSFPSMNNSVIEQLTMRNVSWLELLEDFSSPICPQIKSCQWDNRGKDCLEKMQPIWTFDLRLCCSFNYGQQLLSYHLGLSLVLKSSDEDIERSTWVGLEVLIHESHEIPNEFTPRFPVPSGSEAHIMLRPFVNIVTTNLESASLQERECYLPKEYPLITSNKYNQMNCQAESRTEKIFQSCSCVPPKSPGQKSWKICDLKQIQCALNSGKWYITYRTILTSVCLQITMRSSKENKSTANAFRHVNSIAMNFRVI